MPTAHALPSGPVSGARRHVAQMAEGRSGALARTLAPAPPPVSGTAATDLSESALRLGREIVDLAGFLEEVDKDSAALNALLSDLRAGAAEVAQANASVSENARAIGAATDESARLAEDSTRALAAAVTRIRDLANWARSLETRIEALEDTLHGVAESNADISQIAMQVNILAINASVESARAGPAGRGFAVVADAVGALSRRTKIAADKVGDRIRTLDAWAEDLRGAAGQASGMACEVLAQAEQVGQRLGRTSEALQGIRDQGADIAEHAVAIEQGGMAFDGAMDRMRWAVQGSVEGVSESRARLDGLVDLSEGMVQAAAGLGGDMADARFIALVRAVAGRVSAAFKAGLARGAIDAGQLFDQRYTPIEGTDPPQVMAPFTPFCEQVLPELLEPAAAEDARIIFCAAVDRNGYLPVHNRRFSQPQGRDPVWNAANCRNRRIFNDRVGLKAGRSTAPFLLQTYRRDMGGGNFVLMKDLSAPITVGGRHWGGVRLAVTY